MSSPGAGIDPTRLRVIIGSVVAGVLIVVIAAAAATGYVSGKRSDSAAATTAAATASPVERAESSADEPAASSAPPLPAPTVAGTDAQGFVGTPARCSDGDRPRMIVATAASQSVVCAEGEAGDALYYAAWRFDTQTGTRVAGVLPAGPGWVAHAADATFNITPTALVISTASGEFTEAATGFWAS